ncbi:MAG: four helix bundle protein [candidate division Zixibacteria bacterium]|nr:four helix bundle protein [candidate division Zixibacteria bacterium]
MKSVKDLDVFKLAHEMALAIYKITKSFPEEEEFGLTSQMRRAAYSVPMNLVEGANRLNSREYRQFVGVAKGSAAEVGYQLMLAKDLNYIDENTYKTNLLNYDRICQMLTGLAKSLK